MPANTASDPGHCPLCGKANGCAMEIEKATGVSQPTCWCMQADFSAELLDSVPASARGKACICAACAAAGAQSPDLPSSLAFRKPTVP